MKTFEEFLDYAKKMHGDPARFTETSSGVTAASGGEYVTWKAYSDKVTELTLIINRLLSEKNNAYNQGRQDGPEYNMRNN